MQVDWNATAEGGTPAFDAGELPLVRGGPDNTTHALLDPNVTSKSVRVHPLQFHFHTLSEHTVDGTFVRPNDPTIPNDPTRLRVHPA